MNYLEEVNAPGPLERSAWLTLLVEEAVAAHSAFWYNQIWQNGQTFFLFFLGMGEI